MMTRHLITAAVLLASAGGESLWAQFPPQALPGRLDSAPTPVTELPAPQSPDLYPSPPRPSDWILGTQPDCCGPIGGHGPIEFELYTRSGISLPVSGQLLAHAITPGWFIQGGGRSLFFNPQRDAAWVADLSLSNICNNGPRPNLTFVMLNPPHLFNVRNLNRTIVNFAGGREWWLVGNPYVGGFAWRLGCDIGGGWGSANLHMNQVLPISRNVFTRRSDVIGNIMLDLHTDVEVPFGSARLFSGFRSEWTYTWSDVILGQRCDIQEVNLLLTLGLRY
ncbi:MAG: hypothetical protein NZ700_15545 [Gemmataceae bacterium]|nr:hypothetical protein [Gemmataceae bacterium]MDW8263730.1 hypothetical protein [Gemmataceae bacterium]